MPITDTIDEKTHVRLTLGIVVVCVISLVSFVWNASGWAADMEQTKQVAADTAENLDKLTSVVASQATTQALQQQQLSQILNAQEDAKDEAHQLKEEFIKLRVQLERSAPQ